MQKVLFLIHCRFKNNLYIKRIVIVHLTQICHIAQMLCLHWELFEIILQCIIWVYFLTTNILPPECVGI